jgi:hypothetical protein
MRSYIICTAHLLLLGELNKDELAGHLACTGEIRNKNKILVRKSQENRLAGRMIIKLVLDKLDVKV